MLEWLINQAQLDKSLLDDNDSHSLLSDSNDLSETNDNFFSLKQRLCAKLVVDDAWKIVRGR